jgi:hypothetical protein
MQKSRHACKTSTHKAQTLAASILNISRSDLEEILDTEDELVRALEYSLIKSWLDFYLNILLCFIILRISFYENIVKLSKKDTHSITNSTPLEKFNI